MTLLLLLLKSRQLLLWSVLEWHLPHAQMICIGKSMQHVHEELCITSYCHIAIQHEYTNTLHEIFMSCMWQSGIACDTGSTTSLRQALLIGFANRLARRMTTHNGYKTLSDPPTLAQLHPSTARIAADEDGLLPEWVIYHELISTAKVFLSRVRFCQCSLSPECERLAEMPIWRVQALQLDFLLHACQIPVCSDFGRDDSGMLVSARELRVVRSYFINNLSLFGLLQMPHFCHQVLQ